MLPKDFYPTPEHLIKKMIHGLDFSMITSILEPSAGKGDIVAALKEKSNSASTYQYSKVSLDIDCIELDQNLQHILKGKNYRVVYNDFLTYETMKEYDLIIMNPPFSNGCRHLLKAIEMQKRNGGAVICLLNAETLNNPYSKDRKDLQQKLKEYGAQVEYMQDAFLAAERKTAVEVALIKVQLPEVEKDSFIFSELKKAQEQREFEESEATGLIENDFLKSIVNQFQLEVKAGIKLIKEYYAMKPFILYQFGKDEKTGETVQKGECILSLGLSKNRREYSNSLSVNEYIREVRGKYWKALFENKKFIGQLTGNLQQDYYNKVEELKDYDFSLYNIYELKIDMSKKIIKGIEDTIVGLFEELSNQHHYYNETSKNIHYYNGWKTNKSYIINRKVIIPLNSYGYFQDRYSPSDYTVVQKLSDIEKCFNYLDGGLTDSIDLHDALKSAEESERTKNIQLKYFTVTFYKKGTCHIVFNNPELLKKFNIFGSQHKGWLPPSYGRKAYRDMTEEEKTVVNEFQGEKEYDKVVSNKEYYLFDSNNLVLLED